MTKKRREKIIHKKSWRARSRPSQGTNKGSPSPSPAGREEDSGTGVSASVWMRVATTNATAITFSGRGGLQNIWLPNITTPIREKLETGFPGKRTTLFQFFICVA